MLEANGMFAYARAAIDFWDGWQNEPEFLASLFKGYDLVEDAESAVSRYVKTLRKAKEVATHIGWEGDIREGPFIAGLPTSSTGYDNQYMIAWKQDNNGDTFVFSPYRLPWLEAGDYGRYVRR